MRLLKDILIIAALLFAAYCAVAGIANGQDVTPGSPVNVVTGQPITVSKSTQAKPVITAELREIYQQARADSAEAQLAVTAAQARLEAAVKAMQAVCPLTVDQQGKPQCAPEPPKSEAKKP